MSEENERSSGLTKLLSSARQEVPSAERLSGVLASLEAELGPLSALEPSAPTSGAPTSEPRGTPSAAPWVAVVVTLAVMIAVVLWPRAPMETAREAPVERVEPVAIEPTPPPTPPPPTTPPVPAPSLEVAPTVPETEAAPAERRRPRPSVEAPEAPDPGSELREEMALMERAMTARDRGDLDAARAALAAHRSRFPDGRLAPDRARLERQLDESAPAAPVDDTSSTP